MPLTRPTTIEACCDNGGVSFDNGLECITCAGMSIYLHIASCELSS